MPRAASITTTTTQAFLAAHNPAAPARRLHRNPKPTCSTKARPMSHTAPGGPQHAHQACRDPFAARSQQGGMRCQARPAGQHSERRRATMAAPAPQMARQPPCTCAHACTLHGAQNVQGGAAGEPVRRYVNHICAGRLGAKKVSCSLLPSHAAQQSQYPRMKGRKPPRNARRARNPIGTGSRLHGCG